MPMMSVTAVVRAVGFHNWPDAPPEVAYLALKHRHVFTFKVTLRVGHHNRDVEFHTLQRAIREELPHLGKRDVCSAEIDFGASSCEHLATRLNTLLRGRTQPFYPLQIEVWEDDENGSTAFFAE